MSFLYNGVERKCPIVNGRERLPCQEWHCLAYEEKKEFHEPEGKLEIYKVSYCHAFKKELSVEPIEKGDKK
jgi:hypothetical protein